MYYSRNIQLGDKVLILLPEYVAGKAGLVCAKEVISHGQTSDRWLIRVESDDIVVSLNSNEFEIIMNRIL